jgi:hypothetical protein
VVRDHPRVKRCVSENAVVVTLRENAVLHRSPRGSAIVSRACPEMTDSVFPGPLQVSRMHRMDAQAMIFLFG